MDIRVEILTKELAKEYANEIRKIEKKTSQELGLLYGSPWTNENILIDLPGKWKFSTAVFNEDNLIGYLVMSRWKNNIHGHRMAMSDSVKRTFKVKIAKMLYKRTDIAAIENNIEFLTAIVPEENKSTQKFYLRQGFELLSNDLLKWFIDGRKMSAHVRDGILIDNLKVQGEPYRSVVFRYKYKKVD